MVVKRFLFLLVVMSCFIFNTSTVEAEEEIQSQIRSDIESPSPEIPSAPLIETQKVTSSPDSGRITSEDKDVENSQVPSQRETNLNYGDLSSPNASTPENTQQEDLQGTFEADTSRSSILRDNINIETEVSPREETSRTLNATTTKPKRVLTSLSSTINMSQNYIAIPYPKITVKPRRIIKKSRELTDLYQALTISTNYKNIMNVGNEEEELAGDEEEDEQAEEEEEEAEEEESEEEEEPIEENNESMEEESTDEEEEVEGNNEEYAEEIPQNAYMTQVPYNANGFEMSPINYTAPVMNPQQSQMIQQPIIRNEEENTYEKQPLKRNYEVDNSERDELNRQLVDSQRKMATRLSQLHQENLTQDQQMKNLQKQIEQLQSHISSQEFSGERVSSESINANHEREIVKDTLRYCMDNGLIREEDLDKINFENKVLGLCINCKSKKWITKLPNLGDKDMGICDACSNILCTNAANGKFQEIQVSSQSPMIGNTYSNISENPYNSEYIQQPYYSSPSAENNFSDNFVTSMNGANPQSNYLEENSLYGEMRNGSSYSSEGSSSGGLSGMMGGIFGTVLNKAMNSVSNGSNDNNSNQNSQTQNATYSNQLVMDANGNLVPMSSLSGTAAPYGYVRNAQGMLVPATTPQEAAAGAATASANMGATYNNNTMYANQMVMDANGNLVPMSSLSGTAAPYGYVRNAQGMMVPASSPQQAATAAANMGTTYNNNTMYANQMVMDANGNLVPMSSLAGTAAPYGYVRNAQGMMVPASSPQEATAAANSANQSVLSKITQGASAVSNLAQNSGLASGISNLTSSISQKIAASKEARAQKAAEKKAAQAAKKAEKEAASKKQNSTSASSQNNNSNSQNNAGSEEKNNNQSASKEESDNGAQELAADQAQAKIADLDRKINNVKTKVLPGMESKLQKLQAKLEKMKTNLSRAKNEGAKQRAQAALDNAQKSVDEQQEKINKFNEDIKQWESEKQEAEQKLKENSSASSTSAAAPAA